MIRPFFWFVIASEAKQSIYPLAEAWIASSQTLLAMTGLLPQPLPTARVAISIAPD
ncbi:hypothetical protein JQ641_21260 [Bradyrhizobium sp. JYMT SZCCT0180]|nr:hypothetical protein [Bradyrhizobium sp. JYMT SZCCT0180]